MSGGSQLWALGGWPDPAPPAAARNGSVPSVPPPSERSTFVPRLVPPPPSVDASDGAVVTEATVRALRAEVAAGLIEQQNALQAKGGKLSAEGVRELARGLIRSAVTAETDRRGAAGRVMASGAAEQLLCEAVFAEVFGLGRRLQALVDDAAVENMDVNGFDDVVVEYAGGRLQRVGPVADSDADLVERVERVANYSIPARTWSDARALLKLRLAGGSRLTAWRRISARPGLTIRNHRLVDITLADLVANGTLTEAVAAFLRAAVRARKSIWVTGTLDAGKTTLLRALAAEIDAWEKVLVLEQEGELFLDRLSGRADRGQVVSWEAQEANSEGQGEISLAALVKDAKRTNSRRAVLGEALGAEIKPMLDVMATWPGSMGTLHADTPSAVLPRVVALALDATGNTTPAQVHYSIAVGVRFIVHLDMDTAWDATGREGRRERYVSTVLEVAGIGENDRVSTNEVFHPGPDGRAVPGTSISCQLELERAGLDPQLLGAAW